MPRPNHDFTQPYSLEVFGVANLKKYVPALLPNIYCALKSQHDEFSSAMNDEDLLKLNRNLLDLEKVIIPVENKTSVIICTNFDYIPFVLYDMDINIISAMIDSFQMFPSAYEIFPPAYISTAYIFEGKTLISKNNIAPHTLAQLMIVFKTENLVSFTGARDDWYAKPRRDAK